MTLIILVVAIIAVGAAIAFVVIRGGTPAPTVASMLRRDEQPGDRR